jgi:hypothetical protein
MNTNTVEVTPVSVNRQTFKTFTNSKGTEMTVRMTRGKTGVSVRAALQVEGQEKAVTGARHKFDLTPEGMTAAKDAYAKMLATALAKGWSVKKQPGKVREDAFTEIPDAEPETEVAIVVPQTNKERKAAAKAARAAKVA